MNFKAKVTVMPQKEILDPQGKAVQHALHQIGLGTVNDVRIGKSIEFNIEAPTESEALEKINLASKDLLANMIMEDYKIDLKII